MAATLLLAVTAGAIGVNGYQLWWTNVVASQEQASTVEDLREAFTQKKEQDAFVAAAAAEIADQAMQSSSILGGAIPGYDREAAARDAERRREEFLAQSLLAEGTPLGVVHIPRFSDGFAVPMISGTSLWVLEDGIGWNPTGARPGEKGNLGLAGHRTTWGKPLNQIAELVPGDLVIVETGAGWYTYRVVGHEIVKPTSTEVWAEVPRQPDEIATDAWLTLVACHPPGSLAQRWITYAQMDSFTPRDEGPPSSLDGR
ncbi:class E sortase [Ornithinimicrobium murale]|uniref:class E sortase n=1 Tax=Ornithinimicrobium murale TaxID=1050153 RepID=UPI000E0D2C09|nr:class E sortase [Ornithinimicrobium murale]